MRPQAPELSPAFATDLSASAGPAPVPLKISPRLALGIETLAFLDNDRIVAAFPVLHAATTPTSKPQPALRLVAISVATGKILTAVDAPAQDPLTSGIVASNERSVVVLLAPRTLARYNPDLDLEARAQLPAPVPAGSGGWIGVAAPGGKSVLMTSLSTDWPAKKGVRWPPSQWLLIDTASFAVTQRWTADQKLIPAGIFGTRIAIAQRLAQPRSSPGVSLVKDFAAGGQTKLPPDTEPGYVVFASDGTLVFGTKSTSPHELTMLRKGAMTRLGHTATDMRNCASCSGLVAAASAPRVVAAGEPIAISSWTSSLHQELQSLLIADLRPVVTEQVLTVRDSAKMKDAGPFALSPDGRHLALLVGETIYGFDLPPIGSGQPLPPPDAGSARH